MDRASDSGSEGWGFESLPVYQIRKRIPIWVSSFLFRPPGICFFAFPMVENRRKYATIFLKKLHPRNRRECDEKEIYTG